jgi:DNA-directed RNA polymerase specialized sigma24 family protein
MAGDNAVRELESFLTERADQLTRTAVLLTGSREAGEDRLQTAMERLLKHWRSLDGHPEAYLRRTLYNLAARRPPASGHAPAQARHAQGRHAGAGRRDRRGGPARCTGAHPAPAASAAAVGPGAQLLGAG